MQGSDTDWVVRRALHLHYEQITLRDEADDPPSLRQRPMGNAILWLPFLRGGTNAWLVRFPSAILWLPFPRGGD